MAGEVGAFSSKNQLLERFPSVLRFGNTEQLSFLNLKINCPKYVPCVFFSKDYELNSIIRQ